MRGHQKSYQKKFYDDSDFGCLEIKDFWPTVKTVVFIRSQFPHNILFEGIFRPNDQIVPPPKKLCDFGGFKDWVLQNDLLCVSSLKQC